MKHLLLLGPTEEINPVKKHVYLLFYTEEERVVRTSSIHTENPWSLKLRDYGVYIEWTRSQNEKIQ